MFNQFSGMNIFRILQKEDAVDVDGIDTNKCPAVKRFVETCLCCPCLNESLKTIPKPMSLHHLGEVNKIIWFWTSRALSSFSYSIFILLFYLFRFLVAIKANIYLEKKRYNMIIAVLFAVSQIFALGFACSIDFY